MSLSRVERIHAYSPLRYPGGKTGLLGFLRQLIRTNGLRNVTYVEPYAGGAGAALGLLISEQVDRIVINDLDPAISAFWRTVVEQSSEFAARLRTVPISIDEWRRQRDIYRNPAEHDTFDLGFATFYLNRTNRSGVLNGGPIGGLNQTGTYKIDARFNRDTLLEKIRLIGMFRSRIEVSANDGVEVVAQRVREPNTLIYADPPYFVKGGSLYLSSYVDDDHANLAACLNANASGRWVLTYDDVPQVAKLYGDRHRINFSLSYSAHTAKKAREVMVFADALIAPDSEDSWDRNGVSHLFLGRGTQAADRVLKSIASPAD